MSFAAVLCATIEKKCHNNIRVNVYQINLLVNIFVILYINKRLVMLQNFNRDPNLTNDLSI